MRVRVPLPAPGENMMDESTRTIDGIECLTKRDRALLMKLLAHIEKRGGKVLKIDGLRYVKVGGYLYPCEDFVNRFRRGNGTWPTVWMEQRRQAGLAIPIQ